MTVGVLNTLRSDDKRGGSYDKRSDRLAKIMASQDTTIWVCQEVHTESDGYTLVRKMGGDWRFTRKDTSNAIFFRQNVWQLVASQRHALHYVSGLGRRWAVAGRLTHKATGLRLGVVASHLSHKNTSAAISGRARQAADLVDVIEGLSRDVDLVVGGFDLNSPDLVAVKGKPRGILRAAYPKIEFLSDQRGVANREIESHHGMATPTKSKSGLGRWIDDGFWLAVRKTARFVRGRLFDTYKERATDHNGLVYELEVEV